ncbi:hypothetical protein [Saccharomonospora sp. CUA-673]|uniref:hypothetical protein n=1 Tax=Saccharomonospora sp. CUA-673 TaxID=1904969 RepID=UPI00111531D4|nr:hypothetical protein [Saccharomonospora sp. CUA-673]
MCRAVESGDAEPERSRARLSFPLIRSTTSSKVAVTGEDIEELFVREDAERCLPESSRPWRW